MRYLSGCFFKGMPFMASYRVGGGHKPDALVNIVWAVDNGCFARPSGFKNEGYLAWLDKRPRNALFAAAPDVVGDWPATLERSRPMLAEIRTLGFKAAIVLQDGATIETVPWDECDAVFVGGSTKWKLGPTVPDLVRAARTRSKWAHMGRVNSWVRLRVAAAIGCQSADGNVAVYDRGRIERAAWLERLTAQPFLVF